MVGDDFGVAVTIGSQTRGEEVMVAIIRLARMKSGLNPTSIVFGLTIVRVVHPIMICVTSAIVFHSTASR